MKVLLASLFCFLLGAVPASATPTNHVTGGFDHYNADFWKQDGCFTRGANFSTRMWNVEDNQGTTQIAQSFVFVSIWDVCSNQSVFWAVGTFATNFNLSLSDDLAEARVQSTGMLTAFDGTEVPFAIDLRFVPDTRVGAFTNGPHDCWNAEWVCNRLLRARGGHSEGTLTVNGTEFYTPWWGQTEGILENFSTAMRASVSCLLPVDVITRDCNLLELP